MGLRLSVLAAAAALCLPLSVYGQEPLPELEAIGTQSLVDLEASVEAEISRRADRGDALARQRRFERSLAAIEQSAESVSRDGAAASRDFWHFYAGAVPPGLDDHAGVTGFLGGAGRTWGRLFVSGDGHFLEQAVAPLGYGPPDGGAGAGSAVVVGVAGLDISLGGVVPLVGEWLEGIPFAVLGATRFSVGVCVDGGGCSAAVVDRANAGGGGALVWRWSDRMGVRAGTRWTRSYGLAYDLGFVLAVD